MASSPRKSRGIGTFHPKKVIFLLFVFLAAASPLTAESQERTDLEGKVLDHFELHVYLSLATGMTDGNQIVGLNEGGTFEYHDLALQLRYHINPKHDIIAQIASERRADIPESALADDVELAWLFYRGELSDSTVLRIGRVPLPIGIYNEIRNVGTILPFFQPPYSIYQEASFASASIDGLVISQRFDRGGSWALDLDMYYGSWDFTQRGSSGTVGEAKAENAIGLQLWLETPVSGLRFGFGANHHDVVDGPLQLNSRDDWDAFYFSVDADFQRFLIRAEYNRRNVEIRLSPLPFPDFEARGTYLQAGFHVTDRWSVYAQYDVLTVVPNSAFLPGPSSVDMWKDAAIGVSYAFTTELKLKLELHDNKGFLVENDPTVNFVTTPPAKTKYGILSLAFSR